MNRTPQPPSGNSKGRKYWRSLEEYAETAQYRDWLKREFPAGISETENRDFSRREFLQIMGASLALAGLGLSGCRRPESHLVPFTKTPEWTTPGRSLHYATAMPRRAGVLPLLVTTFDGRPIKIEGHPLHPVSKGHTDPIAQASVLDLYDPDRSRRFLRRGTGALAADFYSELDRLRTEWAKNQGTGLAFLVDETRSPTRERLRQEITRQFPGLTWSTFEPLLPEFQMEATETAFGERFRLLPQYDRAEVILSLDGDFLNAEEGSLSAIHGFTDGRRVEKTGAKMNRLYVVENRYTLTGCMADHRLRLPASQLAVFAGALARELVAQGVRGSLAAVVPSLGQRSILPDVDPAWIREAARDLREHAGRSLVVAGSQHSTFVHLIAHAINQSLGNIGSTLHLIRPDSAPSVPIRELSAKMESGRISTLVILGGNPVYNAPADLNWAKNQKAVPTVIRLGLHEDETSDLSAWHLPAAHYLESWGDGRCVQGSHVSIQPMILPLYDGISDLQLLAKIAGQPLPEGPELVKETLRIQLGVKSPITPDFDEAWTRFVHDGFLANSPAAFANASFNDSRVAAYLDRHRRSPEMAGANRMELVFAADLSVDDGRYLNNGWLQEMPDPVTKLSWENAALISPATARALGVGSPVLKGIVTADVIRIRLNGHEIEAPVLVTPGTADHLIVLPLGYGRAKTGRVGSGSGFNAYPFRTSQASAFCVGASVVRTGRTQPLGITHAHWDMEGRFPIREAPLDRFKREPDFAASHKFPVQSHAPPNRNNYRFPPLTGMHQWGMTIDLNACIGCNACVAACQSENNIPIVGKDQVQRGREMHWIRVDRYYVGEIADNPELVMQPILCMHCENAPCETVCPVNATVHSEEGLNLMAYNRCVGTRYCANNCPYKVRRFNFFDYTRRQLDKLYWGPLGPKGTAETFQMQKNPNVTVRMRGVMEKCTYCIQRIEAARIEQKVRAGASPDYQIPTDSVKTACQQVCPTNAIVFGNLSDPRSAVVKSRASPRAYGLLEYLNVVPRTTYLAKLRNPNLRMPGADQVGMATLDEAHRYGDGHGHGNDGPVKP